MNLIALLRTWGWMGATILGRPLWAWLFLLALAWLTLFVLAIGLTPTLARRMARPRPPMRPEEEDESEEEATRGSVRPT